jgi:hypothetical protein
MTDDTTEVATETDATEAEQQQEQGKTFTQAEVDQLIAQRADRIARSRYPDYDDLKAKAGQTVTAEERLANLEKELTSTRTEALRSRVAARFGISTEPGKDGDPSDADLFLTGADEEALTAQAQRLAARQAESKKPGNLAPKEGESKTHGTATEQEERKYAKNLFSGSD